MFSFDLQPFRRPAAGNPSLMDRRISASLLRNRHALARRLLESLSGWEKYDKHIQNNPSNFDGFISDHFYAFVDYLERYFRLGDSVYKYLYIGEKLKQLHDPALGPEQDLANRSRMTEADVEVLCGPIREELGDEAAGAVEALLCQVRRVVLCRAAGT